MHDDYSLGVMRIAGGFVIVVLLVAVAAVLTMPDDQDLELKHHCEMTQLFATTNGEHGWPDYNNTAHLCSNKEQQV
jgi:hypothetical protein